MPDSLFNPFDPSQAVSVTYGAHLPHWEQIGATYFITWRTWDSMPANVLEAWIRDRDKWLESRGVTEGEIEKLSNDDQLSYHQNFSDRWLRHLDECHGECPFRDPALSVIVSDALHHFHKKRYQLHDFVVMPNHVHVLMTPLTEESIKSLCRSRKKNSALELNNHLNREGRFWQPESFDHLVRNEWSFRAFSSYIRRNPEAAGLKSGEYRLWPAK